MSDHGPYSDFPRSHGYRVTRRATRAVDPESKRLCVALYLQHFEPGALQSRAETLRIYGNQCVTDVNDPHPQVLKAVAPHEEATRLQNPTHFTQNLVL